MHVSYMMWSVAGGNRHVTSCRFDAEFCISACGRGTQCYYGAVRGFTRGIYYLSNPGFSFLMLLLFSVLFQI